MPAHKTSHIQEIQRSLGRRIRELRMKNGWTQEQFAEYCGLHRTYMGHVERGEKNVSLSTVLRVANALGVRIHVLFGRIRASSPADGVGPAHLSARQEPSTGVGRRDVKRLLAELEDQRALLRQILHELSQFLLLPRQAEASDGQPVGK